MQKEVENMNWYVLRVMGGKERKTVDFLEKEIDRLGMQDFVSKILVPTEKVYQIRNGKKVSALSICSPSLTGITNIFFFELGLQKYKYLYNEQTLSYNLF